MVEHDEVEDAKVMRWKRADELKKEGFCGIRHGTPQGVFK